MKLLSDASEYALRAIVWLARQPGTAFKLREIAEGTHAAPGYLIKALQSLARAGILHTQRGNTGGFTLIKKPEELRILEVINAVDPIQRIHTCPLGIASHGTDLCPLHKQIDEAMETIELRFGSTTIADILTQPGSPLPLCDALSPPIPGATAFETAPCRKKT